MDINNLDREHIFTEIRKRIDSRNDGKVKVISIVGGAGSGKSNFLATNLSLRLLQRKQRLLVVMETYSGMEEKVINNIFAKFTKAKDKWFEFIDLSFLPNEMKEEFKAIIAEKLSLLA